MSLLLERTSKLEMDDLTKLCYNLLVIDMLDELCVPLLPFLILSPSFIHPRAS